MLKNNFKFALHAKYTGIFDLSDENAPVCFLPGSMITVEFTGTEIVLVVRDVTGSDNNWINVIIDSGEPYAIHIKKDLDRYVLAQSLENSHHKVEIYKRTEAFFGHLQFCDFELPDGGIFLRPSYDSGRKIEFIGDSITCGDANESLIPDNTDADTENNYLAYGAVAARLLNAEHITVAASGTGCYQNFGGTKAGRMSDYYIETISPMIENLPYLHKWSPDVVVINLGTNDFSADIAVENYKQRYRELLGFIRGRYKGACILCTIGPMRVDPGEYIQAVVEEFNSRGDKNIFYMMFPLIDMEEDGVGGDGHPSVKTHRKMAEMLAGEIKNRLGW